MKTKNRTRRRPIVLLTVDEAFEVMNQAAYERFRWDFVRWLGEGHGPRGLTEARRRVIIAWAKEVCLQHLVAHPAARLLMKRLLNANAKGKS